MFNGIPFECVELKVFSAELVRTITSASPQALVNQPRYERLIVDAQVAGQKSVELCYEGRQLAALVQDRLSNLGFTVSKLQSRTVVSSSVTRPTGKEHYFTVGW